MKKIFILILAVCAVTLASCKKDDAGTLVSLENTTWEGSYLPLGVPNESATDTYVFSANTFSYKSVYGLDKAEGTGTYTYSAPNLTIVIDRITTNGIVTGNKMVFLEKDGTELMTLTRK